MHNASVYGTSLSNRFNAMDLMTVNSGCFWDVSKFQETTTRFKMLFIEKARIKG